MPKKSPPRTFGIEEDPGKLDLDLHRLFCSECRSFLLFHKMELGTLVVKCRRCKQWTTLSTSS